MVATLSLRNAGVWKQPSKIYVKNAGAWVEPAGAWLKSNGVWERFWPTTDPTRTLNLDFTTMSMLDPRITFSRTSLATYYGSDGLLKYAAHNVAFWSEDFSQGTWSKVTSGTVTADVIAAPTGALTADRLNHTLTGTSQGGGVSQTISGVVGQVIVSVYAKAGSKNFFTLSTSTGTASTYAWFDLAAGVVGTKGSGWISTGIASVGGGWYRCWGVVATVTGIWVRVAEADNNFNLTSPGDVYLWGAQVENITLETSPKAYVPTVASIAGGPRFDFDPVTHAAKGLLIEGALVNNNIGRSQDFTNVGSWTKTGVTVTGDQTVAPDGTTTADLITASATPATIEQFASNYATGAPYASSVYAKKGTSDWFYLCTKITGTTPATPKAYFNLNTGTVGTVDSPITTAKIENVGNGWYRCSISRLATSDAETWQAGICDADANSAVTVGRTVYLWGAQDEANATFASSYVPTVGVTGRAADIAVMTGTNFSSWYNQSAGTFVAEFDLLAATGTRAIMQADNNATGEYIALWTSGTAPHGGTRHSNLVTSDMVLGTVAANVINKIGISQTVDDVAACMNGGTVNTDTNTSSTVPVPTQLCIGQDRVATDYLNGHVRRIQFFNTAKSDAELQALTAP